MHTTNDLNDGYIGSGKRLWYSIKKYGKENFKCEILEMLPDRSSLKEREKELVNEELLKDDLCMNLVYGGGGWPSNGQAIGGDKFKAAQLYWEKPENKEKLKKRVSDNSRKLWNEGKMINFKYDWTGKKHNDETKKKIGEANKIKQSGSFNSQFGSQWITNGEQNKKIKMMGIVPTGWKLGRTPKIK
jgi:hypothetical protein